MEMQVGRGWSGRKTERIRWVLRNGKSLYPTCRSRAGLAPACMGVTAVCLWVMDVIEFTSSWLFHQLLVYLSTRGRQGKGERRRFNVQLLLCWQIWVTVCCGGSWSSRLQWLPFLQAPCSWLCLPWILRRGPLPKAVCSPESHSASHAGSVTGSAHRAVNKWKVVTVTEIIQPLLSIEHTARAHNASCLGIGNC